MTIRQLQEIQNFKARFRTLFGHIPSIMFSGSGKVQQMNDAAEEALGLSRRMLIGKSFHQANCRIIDESGKRLSAGALPWNEARTRRIVINNVVTGICLPDGRCQWQQSTSMPLLRQTNRAPKTVVTIFSDITRFKQSQAQYMQYQKMEAIGSLASGLAHDFNNILASILSATQLLLVDLKGSEFEDCEPLKDIEAEALRGAELARELLSFSRPSASRGTTRLNERMHELRKILRRTLPKNIAIELDLAESEMLVSISQTQLEQVLLNLSINARDAMPAGGSIRIKTSPVTFSTVEPPPVVNARLGRYARIDLSDTGSGIPPELLPRIFEPFYTSKEKQGGTGLGLSMIYSIITANRGYIVADSIPARGTTMSLFLPAKPCKTVTRRRDDLPAPPLGGHETVLVVDDELIITKSTSRLLQRYGYHTMTASNGKEALDVVVRHRGRLDIVMLDMEMPEMDGLTCMMKLAEIKPNLKVIMLSGHITRPKMWDMISARTKVFIQKPYDVSHLLKVIRDTLDGRTEGTPEQPRAEGPTLPQTLTLQ